MSQERAEGLRLAAAHIRDMMEQEHGSTDDDVWKHIEWCEQQAREADSA